VRRQPQGRRAGGPDPSPLKESRKLKVSAGRPPLNTFLLQCVTGLQSVVSGELRKAPFGPVEIHLEEDGLVVFTAAVSLRDIKELRYANNCFLVLLQWKRGGIEEGLRLLTRHRDWVRPAMSGGRRRHLEVDRASLRAAACGHGVLAPPAQQWAGILLQADYAQSSDGA
jgi:hypothetical protein